MVSGKKEQSGVVVRVGIVAVHEGILRQCQTRNSTLSDVHYCWCDVNEVSSCSLNRTKQKY